MKITDGLRAEHKVYRIVFGQFEDALPSLTSPMEIQTLAHVVEKLLREHSRRETQLAFLALDHIHANDGPVSAMHHDHREIDNRLIQVHRAGTCSEARRLLKAAIHSAREHFKMEEMNVFPVIERALSSASLEELGTAWLNEACSPEEGQEAVTLGVRTKSPAVGPESQTARTV